jgi:isoaspartyl peptidase/L-asparaginase-like protein (Ntn-hydrolase superfamily)
VIAIDRSGAVTMAFNSPGMKRAVAGAGRQPFVGIR